jgi:hypothetical protein
LPSEEAPRLLVDLEQNRHVVDVRGSREVVEAWRSKGPYSPEVGGVLARIAARVPRAVVRGASVSP